MSDQDDEKDAYVADAFGVHPATFATPAAGANSPSGGGDAAAAPAPADGTASSTDAPAGDAPAGDATAGDNGASAQAFYMQTLQASGYQAGGDPCLDKCWADFKKCCDNSTSGGTECLAALSACQRACSQAKPLGAADPGGTPGSTDQTNGDPVANTDTPPSQAQDSSGQASPSAAPDPSGPAPDAPPSQPADGATPDAPASGTQPDANSTGGGDTPAPAGGAQDFYTQTLQASGYQAGGDACLDQCWADFKKCCDNSPTGGTECLAQLNACKQRCAQTPKGSSGTDDPVPLSGDAGAVASAPPGGDGPGGGDGNGAGAPGAPGGDTAPVQVMTSGVNPLDPAVMQAAAAKVAAQTEEDDNWIRNYLQGNSLSPNILDDSGKTVQFNNKTTPFDVAVNTAVAAGRMANLKLGGSITEDAVRRIMRDMLQAAKPKVPGPQAPNTDPAGGDDDGPASGTTVVTPSGVETQAKLNVAVSAKGKNDPTVTYFKEVEVTVAVKADGSLGDISADLKVITVDLKKFNIPLSVEVSVASLSLPKLADKGTVIGKVVQTVKAEITLDLKIGELKLSPDGLSFEIPLPKFLQ